MEKDQSAGNGRELETDTSRELTAEIRQRIVEIEVLSREEEVALFKKWKEEGCIKSRNQLVEAHQKLAFSMARSAERYGASMTDLFHEAIEGLIRAADDYDVEKGNRFSTYSQWWILTKLQDFIQRESPVRLGRSRWEKQVLRALSRAKARYGNDEIETVKQKLVDKFQKDGMDITMEDINRVEGAWNGKGFSLNSRIDNEEDAEFIDFLSDDEAGANEMMNASLEHNQQFQIDDILDGLDERTAMVIRGRFLSKDEKTLKELAAVLQISAERVRQIEKDGLAKMRNEFERRGISVDDILQESAIG